MKTNSLPVALIGIITFLLASCGSNSNNLNYGTDDLRYIPLKMSSDNFYTYVDTKTGQNSGCYEYATLYHEGIASVIPCNSDGFIYIDHNQEQVIPDTFAYATNFNEGIAFVARRGQPISAIDTKGETLFELKEAEFVYEFHNGVALFGNEGNLGIVDREGNITDLPSFSNSTGYFINGLMAVYEFGDCQKWGLINRKGENVTSCGYDHMLYDKENLIKSLTRYNSVTALKQGRIPVCVDGKWGVINTEDKFIINPQFDLIVLDGDNYLFRKDWRYGWCDSKGKYIINPQFHDAKPSEGAPLMAVKDDNGYGYINRKGKWVIEAQFSDALPFFPSGIAFVKDNSGDWGAINTQGEWVINPQFDGVLPISDDITLVITSNDKIGIINQKGEYIVNPEYSDFTNELLYNRYGGLTSYAQSDFVDVQAIASHIAEALSEVKALTTGDLKNDLGEKAFSKEEDDIKIYDKEIAHHVEIALKANKIKAWNRVSDGWFGYKYVFLPNIPISSYTATVSFSGKNARFTHEIAEALKTQLASTSSAEVVTQESASVINTPERKIVITPFLNNIVILITIK